MALINGWVHVLTVVLWVGGMLFMALVMVPEARNQLESSVRARFISAIGKRFRTITWASLGVLIVTGILNIHFRVAAGLTDIRPFMRLLTVKLLIVLIMIALTAIHDFVLGPRATLKPGGPPLDEETLRRRIIRLSLFARINVLLGVIVVLLGLSLSHLH